MSELIPILGILTGTIVPVAAFIMVYFEAKNKKEAIVEIAKHIEDPLKIDEMGGEILCCFPSRELIHNKKERQKIRFVVLLSIKCPMWFYCRLIYFY